MQAVAARDDLHSALDLIDRIDARGVPRHQAARYRQLRRAVMARAHDPHRDDLGGVDELGGLPLILAQLAALAGVAYVGWKVFDPVNSAVRTASPFVVWGAAGIGLWWLFEQGRKR